MQACVIHCTYTYITCIYVRNNAVIKYAIHLQNPEALTTQLKPKIIRLKHTTFLGIHQVCFKHAFIEF